MIGTSLTSRVEDVNRCGRSGLLPRGGTRQLTEAGRYAIVVLGGLIGDEARHPIINIAGACALCGVIQFDETNAIIVQRVGSDVLCMGAAQHEYNGQKQDDEAHWKKVNRPIVCVLKRPTM